MNDNIKSLLKTIGVGCILVILTILYVWWRHYLSDHFAGEFDAYGLPSKMFRSGWFLLVDAWELWVIPTLIFLIIGLSVEYWCRHILPESSHHASTHENDELKEKEMLVVAEKKAHQNISFSHALEIEALKQQVEILKKKYLEERQHAEQTLRDADEMLEKAKRATPVMPSSAAPTSAPSNAHSEAVITSLRAENKKLQQQVTDLQEDLDQSNALIEKLLEEQKSS